jgi:hypothetical protein
MDFSYRITADENGTGTGSVTPDPTGIACDGTCQTTYMINT